MYLEHFGLSEPPFRITPHTDFFFAGANRGATLDALIYAITHDEGIVKVSGEVGSGKTMLCRVLMERLPSHVTIIYLANPSLSREDILFAIADELDLAVEPQARASAVLRALQEKLITLYANGRQVVVLIDEAHAMPKETLEEIRLLSNLESSRHKLLQLVLFGQPELNETLARNDMRQLKERITHNFSLEPLVRDDIAQYLDFRMRAAGYRGPEIFSPAAVKQIAGASEGLTRRINILADKALLAAYTGATHQVTPREVRAAVQDSEFSSRRRGGRRQYLAGGLIALLAVIAVLLAPRPEPAAPTASPAPSQPQATAQPTLSPAPAPAAPTPASAGAGDDDPRLGSQTRQKLADTHQWLVTVPDKSWFIQLLATDGQHADRVEQFIVRTANLVDRQGIHVYAARKNGERRLGVIYGQFDTRQEAEEALARLPTELQSHKPFLRQVRQLR